MSSEIYRNIMVREGLKSWHGSDNYLSKEDAADPWKVIEAAGLEYTLEKKDITYFCSPEPFYPSLQAAAHEGLALPRTHKGHKLVIRTDSQESLAVVSDKYHIVQPRTVVTLFAEALKKYDMHIETAGSLDGGRKYWAMAAMPEGAYDVQGDQVLPYALMSSSCDLSQASEFRFTDVFTVCANTLEMARSRSALNKQTHATPLNPDVWETMLDRSIHEYLYGQTDRIEFLNECTYYPMTDEALREFFSHVSAGLAKPWYVHPAGEYSDAERRVYGENKRPKHRRIVKGMFHSYVTGPGQDHESRRGTLYGAINAVTHYCDHGRGGARASNNILGKHEAMKRDAVGFAQYLLDRRWISDLAETY